MLCYAMCYVGQVFFTIPACGKTKTVIVKLEVTLPLVSLSLCTWEYCNFTVPGHSTVSITW